MASEENKALVCKLFEAVNHRTVFDIADEIIASDYLRHFAGYPAQRSLEEYKNLAAMVFTGFPDFRIAIDDLIAENDKVVARVTLRATHQGELFGHPATGKRAEWACIQIFRIAGGKLVEEWTNEDIFSQRQQLGWIPSP